MQVRKDTIVSIDYTLTNDAGRQLDTSAGHGPLAYLHGHQQLIPGLERALEGKEPGDHFNATIAPSDAYGQHDPELVQSVPRSMFPSDQPIMLGQQFRSKDDDGMHLVRIAAIDEQNVKVDGNHPLAGQTLHFDLTVRAVRDATPEEIEHGHAHEPGGHSH
jgi:FKBP-type peptidyl-prolyl cis-trans isomerase SlyD